MPTLQRDGMTVNYQVQGAGEPLLLLMGLAARIASWRYQAPELAQSFQLIMLDNRGSGQSSAPLESEHYSMRHFATDAVAVLDELGIERAHVFGVSMGGMIAQHMALNYAERVRGMVLGCTTPAGPQAVQPEPWVVQLLMSGASKSHHEALVDSVRFNFSPDFAASHPEVVAEYIERGLEQRTPPHAFAGQWQAVLGHNTFHDLGRISAPTLVQHGTADVLVPFSNGELLTQSIPGARMEPFAGAGHVYFIEQPGQVNASIRTFLQELDQ